MLTFILNVLGEVLGIGNLYCWPFYSVESGPVTEILVRRKKLVCQTNIPGKMARADHFPLKILVRDWNIGPSCINCMQRSQWGGSKLSLNALTSKGTEVSVVLSLQGLPWSC